MLNPKKDIMKKIVLAVIGILFIAFLVGDCDDFAKFIAMKVLAFALLGVFCQLWKHWNMDDDPGVKDYLDE